MLLQNVDSSFFLSYCSTQKNLGCGIDNVINTTSASTFENSIYGVASTERAREKNGDESDHYVHVDSKNAEIGCTDTKHVKSLAFGNPLFAHFLRKF
jgi:hypothetical protein